MGGSTPLADSGVLGQDIGGALENRPQPRAGDVEIEGSTAHAWSDDARVYQGSRLDSRRGRRSEGIVPGSLLGSVRPLDSGARVGPAAYLPHHDLSLEAREGEGGMQRARQPFVSSPQQCVEEHGGYVPGQDDLVNGPAWYREPDGPVPTQAGLAPSVAQQPQPQPEPEECRHHPRPVPPAHIHTTIHVAEQQGAANGHSPATKAMLGRACLGQVAALAGPLPPPSPAVSEYGDSPAGVGGGGGGGVLHATQGLRAPLGRSALRSALREGPGGGAARHRPIPAPILGTTSPPSAAAHQGDPWLRIASTPAAPPVAPPAPPFLPSFPPLQLLGGVLMPPSAYATHGDPLMEASRQADAVRIGGGGSGGGVHVAPLFPAPTHSTDASLDPGSTLVQLAYACPPSASAKQGDPLAAAIGGQRGQSGTRHGLPARSDPASSSTVVARDEGMDLYAPSFTTAGTRAHASRLELASAPPYAHRQATTGPEVYAVEGGGELQADDGQGRSGGGPGLVDGSLAGNAGGGGVCGPDSTIARQLTGLYDSSPAGMPPSSSSSSRSVSTLSLGGGGEGPGHDAGVLSGQEVQELFLGGEGGGHPTATTTTLARQSTGTSTGSSSSTAARHAHAHSHAHRHSTGHSTTGLARTSTSGSGRYKADAPPTAATGPDGYDYFGLVDGGSSHVVGRNSHRAGHGAGAGSGSHSEGPPHTRQPSLLPSPRPSPGKASDTSADSAPAAALAPSDSSGTGRDTQGSGHPASVAKLTRDAPVAHRLAAGVKALLEKACHPHGEHSEGEHK